MNKKGQSLIFGIMLMFFALITVTIMLPPMIEVIDTARGADSLDCANTTISTGQRATCLVMDIYLPYFVATALFLAGGYLVVTGAKKSFT